MTKEEIFPEIKKLVLWRLDAEVPKDYKLSVGNKGSFTKEELKEHIENEDEIGRLCIHIQIKLIKDIASGEFTRVLAK